MPRAFAVEAPAAAALVHASWSKPSIATWHGQAVQSTADRGILDP
jgi:hypothetical protein